MVDLRSLDKSEIEELIVNMGEAKFRGKQVFEWVHKKFVDDISEMTNLSLPLRKKLSENAKITKAEIVKKLVSQKDDVAKYLFELENDNIIESVFMKYTYGNSVCVSTQAGCRMGCRLCASTVNGLSSNLTPGQMLAQVYGISKDTNERVSNVVLMGSGEPLDNYDNVIKFLRLLNDPDGANIGARHITLSTCGLVERIYDLAEIDMPITLAISLHAPNDKIRREIMPVAKRYNIETLIKACKNYADTTKRRITFEYALIKGLNDSKDHAVELAKLLKGILCHVNLIPANEIKERDYKKSPAESVQSFLDTLTKYNIDATLRRSLGNDIQGACGQLRQTFINKEYGNEEHF